MCIFPLQVITLLFLTSKAANITNKTKQDNNREKNQPVNNKRRGGTSKSKRIQAEKYKKKTLQHICMNTTNIYQITEDRTTFKISSRLPLYLFRVFALGSELQRELCYIILEQQKRHSKVQVFTFSKLREKRSINEKIPQRIMCIYNQF